jgi:hypothetical protein
MHLVMIQIQDNRYNKMPQIYYDDKGFPIFRPQDGWKDQETFRAAALNDMARKQQAQQTPQEQQLNSRDPYAEKVANLLPTVGGALGMVVPGGGETGLTEALGAAAGTAGKRYLKGKYPETFGENPQGMAGAADTATDFLAGALPGIAGGVLKGAGALSSGLAKALLGSRIGNAASALSSISLNPLHLAIIKAALLGGGAAYKQPDSKSSGPSQ